MVGCGGRRWCVLVHEIAPAFARGRRAATARRLAMTVGGGMMHGIKCGAHWVAASGAARPPRNDALTLARLAPAMTEPENEPHERHRAQRATHRSGYRGGDRQRAV